MRDGFLLFLTTMTMLTGLAAQPVTGTVNVSARVVASCSMQSSGERFSVVVSCTKGLAYTVKMNKELLASGITDHSYSVSRPNPARLNRPELNTGEIIVTIDF